MEACLRRSRQQLVRERVLVGFAAVGQVVPNGLLLVRLVRGEPILNLYGVTCVVLAPTAFLA
ncbi:hypothetical protein ACL02T_23755 [Pseudonocardia sp. RS010]|uniref:hypothetical protein n=1 Tax=Pseudonocardia sp. RS010 TaxID=3385979 RepID=UPI00399F8585